MGINKKKDPGKLHYCPECGVRAKLFMRIPGRAMWGLCENDHRHKKTNLILK